MFDYLIIKKSFTSYSEKVKNFRAHLDMTNCVFKVTILDLINSVFKFKGINSMILTSFFSVLAYLDIADCGGTTRQGLPLRPLPPILTFNLTEI